MMNKTLKSVFFLALTGSISANAVPLTDHDRLMTDKAKWTMYGFPSPEGEPLEEILFGIVTTPEVSYAVNYGTPRPDEGVPVDNLSFTIVAISESTDTLNYSTSGTSNALPR